MTGAVREQGCLTKKVDWEPRLVPGYDGRPKYRKGCHAKEAKTSSVWLQGMENKPRDENYRDMDFYRVFKR